MLKFNISHVIQRSMLWNILKSVKLAVFLLITLAIVAVIGTLIPQGEDSIRFAMGLKPEIFRIFSILGLFDVYHTLWFRAILAILCLNLIVCSIDRLPKSWKRMKSDLPIDMQGPFKNIKEDHIIECKGDMILVYNKIKNFLEKRFKHIKSKIEQDKAFFYLEQGSYSHLGVYLVHLSIVLILLGGIIGSIWGFEGYMNIIEGEKRNLVRLSKKIKPIKLNFYVRCDKFLVDFYKNGMPKEYRSKLTFIIDHKKIKKDLRVNHPINFNGITFYQASYGRVFGNKVLIKIVNNLSKKNLKLWLPIGKFVNIPNTDLSIKVIDIREDLAGTGPVIFVIVKNKKGKAMKLILFKNIKKAQSKLPKPMLKAPMFNPSLFKPFTFSIDKIEAKYYTGLQVTHDPGVPVVWIGFIMLILGLMVTFFIAHKRIWIRINKKDNNFLEIAAAGMTNRDPSSLSRNIIAILKDIKKEVESNV